MGVIKRQSLKASVVSYIGAGIGMISVLFIIPYCLSLAQIGLIRLISDVVLFFGSLALFGSGYSVLYFFPQYSDNKKKLNGFLSLQLLIGCIGFLCVTAFFVFGEPLLIKIYSENASEFLNYLYIIPPMIFFVMLLMFFEAHSSNFLKITIPKIVREIVMRLLLIVSVLLFFLHFIPFESLILSQFFIFVTAATILFFYLRKVSTHPIRLSTDFPPLSKRREIVKFNSFVVLGVFGGILANKIDSFFLAQTSEGLDKNGIYTTALFIIALIEIPTRNILTISIPVLSKALFENDLQQVGNICRKSSITLLVSSLFIFLCIWLSIDNLFQIMPNGEQFAAGKSVILFLGIAKIFEASSSINLTVVGNSKYYRYSLLFQILLGVFTILTAIYFIPRYGIKGAALSTSISIFLYQLIILLFVYSRFHILPFTRSTFKILLIASSVYLVVLFIPLPFHGLLQIILRSAAIALLYIPMTYFFKISPDINELADHLIAKFKPGKGN